MAHAAFLRNFFVLFLVAGAIFNFKGALAQDSSDSPHRYNVKTFGAVGDGLTNDAPAIQAALDAAAKAGGGTVYLPVGTYLLDRQRPLPQSYFSLLTIQSKVNIEGDDVFSNDPSVPSQSNSILLVAPHLNGSQTVYDSLEAWKFSQFFVITPGSDSGPRIARTLLEHCSFKNFTIDFNGAQNGYSMPPFKSKVRTDHHNWGIGTHGRANDILIDNVTFLNNTGDQSVSFIMGNVLPWSSHIRVHHCTFHNSGDVVPGSGAWDHSSVFMQATDWQITNNRFINDRPSIYATGIEFYGSNGVVSGNYVDKDSIGMNVCARQQDLYKTSIKNNIIKNARIGMDLWTTKQDIAQRVRADATIRDVTIEHNTITLRPESNFGGIVYSTLFFEMAPQNLIIKDNSISQAGNIAGRPVVAGGIHLTKGDHLTIINNRISHMSGRGIDLYGDMSDLDIEGNQIKDVALGINPHNPKQPYAYAQGIALHMGPPVGSSQGAVSVNIIGNHVYNSKGHSIQTGLLLYGAISDLHLDNNSFETPQPIENKINNQ